MRKIRGGGEGVWLNLRLNLRKIRGGREGVWTYFLGQKKKELEVLTDGPLVSFPHADGLSTYPTDCDA